MENKTKNIILRLTEKEYEKIFSAQRKTHLTKSEFCRRILLGQVDTILTKNNKETRDDIRNLLRWTSININQMARSLNGILKNGKPLEFSSGQSELVGKLTKLISTWAEAKRRII